MHTDSNTTSHPAARSAHLVVGELHLSAQQARQLRVGASAFFSLLQDGHFNIRGVIESPLVLHHPKKALVGERRRRHAHTELP
jgi:hypothetical protein